MIDEEIREALDVDPSPEFLARVRTRIAAEPEPSAWRWSWGLAAACALAASVVLATIVSRPHEAKPVAVPAPAPAVDRNNPPPAVSTREGDTHQGDAGLRTGRALTPHPRSTMVRIPEPEPQPEILIDQREMRTLRVLIDGVRNGRVDLTAAMNSRSHTPAELEPVADIVIAPLTIEPIAPVPGAEGVRP